MATARGITGPEPTAATHRWAIRLRASLAVRKAIRGTDGSDVLTVVALGFLFIGLFAPSAAFGVVGGLLVLLTPVGAALRVLIRGR